MMRMAERQKLTDEHHRFEQAIEVQAGLARGYMARGETEQALTHVDEILVYMEANSPPSG